MLKLSNLLACILLLITSSASARGGDLVNNGGGLAEKNVFYAYTKLDTYIKACLESPVCKVSDSQKLILMKILDSLPKELATPAQLIFASEKKTPGTFILDGNVRIAKTGNLVGSPIFLNVDLLYTKDQSGMTEAATIPEAVAILIHELGHHHGGYSHEELDLLGVNVSLFLQRKLIVTPMIPWESEISASVFNPKSITAFPEVLLYVGNDIIDLSPLYKKIVQCDVLKIPIPILPIDDISLIQSAPLASTLYNLHWNKIKEKNDSLELEILGNVSNMCVLKSMNKIRNNDFKLSIKVTVRKVNDIWVYDPQTLNLDQFSSPWYKLIKF